MIGLLTNRYILSLIGAGAVLLSVWAIKHKMDSLEDQMWLARDRAAKLEVVLAQCNRNVAAMNADLELQAAISEVEQIEREKLMEEIDDHRRIRVSKTQKARQVVNTALRDIDCARAVLPDDVIRLSDAARANANQYPTD